MGARKKSTRRPDETTSRSAGGGSATAAGMAFQAEVAAAYALAVLAEEPANIRLDLPAGAIFNSVRCESGMETDDVLVGHSLDGSVFVQAKRHVDASEAATSDFGQGIRQLTRQFRLGTDEIGKPYKPFDPVVDRLVFAVGQSSSSKVRNVLRVVLRRLAGGGSAEPKSAEYNQDEADVLAKALLHIRAAWGGEPTLEEVRMLASVLRVDVRADPGDPEGPSELLSSNILVRREQAPAAWTALTQECLTYARERRGGTRLVLAQRLRQIGIDLRSAPSFQRDISTIREHTDRVLSKLGSRSVIHAPEGEILVPRSAVGALASAVAQGSLLVIGDPGTGKSTICRAVMEQLRSGHADLVALAVADLVAGSSGELRQELGLDHELMDILENWEGLSPGYVLVDGLDAVPGAPAAHQLRELAASLAKGESRWKVVGSVRTFDLREGARLRHAFSGLGGVDAEPANIDSSLSSVRHFKVAVLNDEELDVVMSKSPTLKVLLTSSRHQLRTLLRVPFNLDVAGELLGAGVPLADLGELSSQVQLLDRLWELKVAGDGRRILREGVLRRLAEKMLAARSLRLSEAEIEMSAGDAAIVTEMVSAGVLESIPNPIRGRATIAFPHKALHDFAVERLLFDEAHLRQTLAADKEVTLIAWPSLRLHFQRLWNSDDTRERFWKVALELEVSRDVPDLAKLAAPALAAEEVRLEADLEPLVQSILAIEVTRQQAARRALRRLVSAALSLPYALAPKSAFYRLLGRLASVLDLELARSLKPLVWELTERPSEIDAADLSDLGAAARGILEVAWSTPIRDSFLVTTGILAVGRTFESDATQSTTLLSRALEPDHLAMHGFDELHRIADVVPRLVGVSPDFVESVYVAAFGYEESSTAATPLTASRIMPLISNRRQDYASALYQLGEGFPKYFDASPVTATRALGRSVEGYVRREHKYGGWTGQNEAFKFGAKLARIVADVSHLWDSKEMAHHEPVIGMLNAFESGIDALAGAHDLAVLQAIIDAVCAGPGMSAMWVRLMSAGTRNPELLGRALMPLIQAPAVLGGMDTAQPATAMAKSLWPTLSDSERKSVLAAAEAIPDRFPADKRDIGESRRDSILAELATSSGGSIVGPS
jgi:ATPase family protein associated with various cellular activities (AAA)